MDKKLENEYFKLKKELQRERAKNKELQVGISELREELKDMRPSKSTQRIKELKGKIATLEQVSDALRDQIYKLEQEKKQMVQGKSMVSQAEYEALLKQLEHERQSKEQYQRLYGQETDKRDELKGCFKTENENKTVICPTVEENENLSRRIKELEAKLSRKGAGKPKNNNTTDQDVIKLREDGKAIREIGSITGMSTATVVKILKV